MSYALDLRSFDIPFWPVALRVLRAFFCPRAETILSTGGDGARREKFIDRAVAITENSICNSYPGRCFAAAFHSLQCAKAYS